MRSKWRIFVVAFWLFVGVMLAKQAFEFNNKTVEYSTEHPEKHWFYNPGGGDQAKPVAAAPDIRQVLYHVKHSSPEIGSFTVDFAVKNVGTVAATAIQVKVRPYRGIIVGNVDDGHAHRDPSMPDEPIGPHGDLPAGPISDESLLAQFGTWIAMPDLAPGQSATNSVTFADDPTHSPNEKPKLEIIFEPLKPKQ